MGSEWLKLADNSDILERLRELDDQLDGPATVILAGSAVPILAGCKFRATADIDFAVLPDAIVSLVVQSTPSLSAVFDFKAAGVIGLLVDFDERIVPVTGGFRSLRVYRLSLEDWVVSKLASPKLADVLNVSEVSLEMLKKLQGRMPYYGGVSDIQANSDLNWLINQREQGMDGADAVPRIKLF